MFFCQCSSLVLIGMMMSFVVTNPPVILLFHMCLSFVYLFLCTTLSKSMLSLVRFDDRSSPVATSEKERKNIYFTLKKKQW